MRARFERAKVASAANSPVSHVSLQNRVTPFGEIVASSSRGLMMGNRGGCFHRPDRTLGSRRWASRQWISCVLDFNGRRRAVMSPGRYTELFFLDEATAFAAGHRPCFECRRVDAMRFATTWATARHCAPPARAADMDRALHAERLADNGTKRCWPLPIDQLPDGCLILVPGLDGAYLIAGARLLRWTFEGYDGVVERPANVEVLALTPPSTIGALKSGYRPLMHATATQSV